MNTECLTRFNHLQEFFGTLVSLIMFAVTDFFHLLYECDTLIIVFALFIFFAGILFIKKSTIKVFLIWFSLSLLVFVYVGTQISRKSSKDAELIADATESFVEDYYDMLDNPQESEWLLDAIQNENIKLVLVPAEVNISNFLQKMYDVFSIQNSSSGQSFTQYKAFNSSWIKQNGRLIHSKYHLIWLYTPHLKDNCSFEGMKCLPESSYIVMNGMRELKNKNWEKGRTLLEKADSSGNAAGTFYLSMWYGAGLNCEPNVNRQEYYLKKAAKMGSRQARTEYGKKLLASSASSSKRGEGAEYLRKASVLNTVATSITVKKTEEALFAISNYYQQIGKRREAYVLTKSRIEDSNNPNIKFVLHLDNCIKYRKYKEALEIIKEGELYDDPHSIVVHAGMYTYGYGEERDFIKAEKLLRFAADSLDYYPAYKGLADLYRESRRDGSEFWDSLYNLKYSNRIEGNCYE